MTHFGSFTLPAPAKINWFLRVLSRRPDGYHDIESLMQCVELFDYLTFEEAETLEVVADLDIPTHDNIIYKAACLLKDYCGTARGVRITVKKNIPVGAGLGGGSSDAACTFLGLSRLWDLRLSATELSSLGASAGSDVPFFFSGPASSVAGRGEKVFPAIITESFVLLLVKPATAVSTAWAYSRLDERPEPKLTKKNIDIKLFCRALNNRDFASLCRLLCNDFEEVIMGEFPVVREIKERLLSAGAAIAAMSGSGPSVFGVFRDRVSAERAMEKVRSHFCCITRTII